MKKESYLLVAFIILSLFTGCSRVPPHPEQEGGERKQIPVFEVFGYARCSNCPIVERAVDSLKRVYKDSIIVLEYHMRLAGDTISPENIDERISFYDIGNAAPVTIIQGIHKINGAESDVPSQIVSFENYYSSLRARTDSVGLKILIDTTWDSIEFVFDADSLMNADSTRDVLFVMLTEDSVKFVQSGATDSIYNNVVRYFESLPGKLPLKFKMELSMVEGKNFVAILQDTVTKNIISGHQRRF